jgi:putative hemolysin
LDPEPYLVVSDIEQIWPYIGLVILLVLLVISALISGSELAFYSLSEQEIDKASSANNRRGKRVLKLLEKPQKLLATILITNNFINILIVLLFAFIGEVIFMGIPKVWVRFLVEVILITSIILLFSEVLPKVYARRNALKLASVMALPLTIAGTLVWFISKPLLSMTNIIENQLGKKNSDLNVEKLSQALELTADEETTADEQKILQGIVSFGNTETGQIMTPRIDIFGLPITASYKEVIAKIITEGFSRNPVYKDNMDEIVGVLYAKDLLPYLNKEHFDWKKLIREPYFVPENKKLDDLLREFQEKKNHLAIVVDEYGGTSGVISLEDVIEEIVGDINDEFDDDDMTYTRLDTNNFLFEGKTNLKDFYKILELDNSDLFDERKGESETIAGFILEICGKFPKKNEVFSFGNCKFKIESMDRKRIKKIKVTVKRKNPK